MQEARPVLPARVGEERELGDDQERRADLCRAEIELAGIVAEDPQFEELVSEIIGVAFLVGVRHPDQQAVSGADRCLPAVPSDRGRGDALHHGAHQGGGFQPLSWESVRWVNQLSTS